MKSHANSLLIVASGLLKDVRAAYPEYQGVVRDLTSLTLLVKNRGLGVFTLDLPARLDAVVKGLETGRLEAEGTTRYSKAYPVPRLFAGLYMRIFDSDLCLKEDIDINALAFLIQLLKIGKKTEVACSQKRLHDAVRTFHDIEKELIDPTLAWDGDTLDPDGVGYGLHLHNIMVDNPPDSAGCESDDVSEDWGLLDRCQQVADIIAEALGEFDPYLYSEERHRAQRSYGFRHGPGAVAVRETRKNKFAFPYWSAKLQHWYPFEDYGRMPNDPRGSPENYEAPSRLIAVPKTAKGPRLIASEPVEHQWCQQLTLRWFEERFADLFKGSFITLNDQRPSGEFARLGSLDKRFATVDLSSASDRLTCYVIERLFRRNPTLLQCLHATRTRYLLDEISRESVTIKLKKFASQGTAVTFPVQSVAFLICTLACSIKGEITWQSIRRMRNKVRVFGDDIVIPTHGYAGLVRLLSRLQLKVNEGKSFVLGHFRESCGVDAYKGYDVTPIAPKTTLPDNPASRKSVLDTYNNLFVKGYWYASDSLESTNGCDFLKRVTIMGRDAGASAKRSFSFGTSENQSSISGFLVGQPGADAILLSVTRGSPRNLRWNADLHRFEVRSYAVWDRTKERPSDGGYSGMLQFSTAEPRRGDFSLPRLSRAPERPHPRDGMRWEALSDLLG